MTEYQTAKQALILDRLALLASTIAALPVVPHYISVNEYNIRHAAPVVCVQWDAFCEMFSGEEVQQRRDGAHGPLTVHYIEVRGVIIEAKRDDVESTDDGPRSVVML